MFQVASQKQRRTDHAASTRTVEHTPAVAPGKQTLTEQYHGAHLGAPSNYDRAVDNATRELHAIKTVALPRYVEARRATLEPLAKEIGLARAAMQVRHMLLSANAHVYALEKGQTYADPLVVHLRQELERLVSIAFKLGVYRDAEDMRPQSYVEPKQGTPGGDRHSFTRERTPAPAPVTTTSHNPAAPAQVTQPGNTRAFTAAPARQRTVRRLPATTAAPVTRLARGTS